MKVYLCGEASKSKTLHANRPANLKRPHKITYSWNRTKQRKVKSRIVDAVMTADYAYFVTLTFPTELNENKAVSKYLENLKKRNYVTNYVWVKEKGSKGRLHYHLLFTSHRLLFEGVTRLDDINVFQTAWNSAMRSSGGSGSNNSFRLGDEPRVTHPNKIASYITKYMTKSNGTFDTRNYSCSYGLKEYIRIVDEDIAELSADTYCSVDNPFAHLTVFRISSQWFNTVTRLGKVHDFLVEQYHEHIKQKEYVNTYSSREFNG